MDMDGKITEFANAVEGNNRRAIKSGSIGELTEEDLKTAFTYFDGKCAYSGQPIDEKSKMSIEHIIPIMSGGHSLAFNCVPVINDYNSSKSGYHLLDWWNAQSDGMGNTLYNPYRLLKLLNYMVKCLEHMDIEDKKSHVLNNNDIDVFLKANVSLLYGNKIKNSEKKDYKKISQLEILRKLDILRIEDTYSIYEELDGIKLNTAIFFEEAVHALGTSVPRELITSLEEKISSIPNIYKNGKKIFKKEMNIEDINIRKAVLEWTEKENIENKFGIIGYMDFEVLKEQANIENFFNDRKETVLASIGANKKDFNDIVNKVPNILTNLNVESRISDIKNNFGISIDKNIEKSSEMYRYIVNKPDLLL